MNKESKIDPDEKKFFPFVDPQLEAEIEKSTSPDALFEFGIFVRGDFEQSDDGIYPIKCFDPSRVPGLVVLSIPERRELMTRFWRCKGTEQTIDALRSNVAIDTIFSSSIDGLGIDHFEEELYRIAQEVESRVNCVIHMAPDVTIDARLGSADVPTLIRLVALACRHAYGFEREQPTIEKVTTREGKTARVIFSMRIYVSGYGAWGVKISEPRHETFEVQLLFE